MNAPLVLLKTPSAHPRDDTLGEVVTALGERSFLVAQGPHRQLCMQAFSCLITPVVGDRVLLAHTQGSAFILAILERRGDERPACHLPHGLDIDSDAELRIAGAALELAPQALRVETADLDCQAARLNYSCAEARGFVGVGKLVGRVIELLTDKWVQVSKQSYRISEQLDCIRTAELDCEAGQTLRLHGKNTLVSADQLSKLDARQIHIG
ncbi:DUF3540 domain-containing protein [Pseudomonas sp. SCB32]|uniref:DUF3540 domain-containing protein n=1 Tax=Pseudomonas sp. SCB32 TaxID=2653853 RepID=UPI0015B6D297|nr:DUF3540 domain-containing protein [Pseudomonas sp. SCB32]